MVANSKIADKAKIDYTTDNERWKGVLKVINGMMLVLSLLFGLYMILSAIAFELIATIIFASLLALSLLAIQNIKKSKIDGTIKSLALPLRIFAIVLGVFY